MMRSQRRGREGDREKERGKKRERKKIQRGIGIDGNRQRSLWR